MKGAPSKLSIWKNFYLRYKSGINLIVGAVGMLLGRLLLPRPGWVRFGLVRQWRITAG